MAAATAVLLHSNNSRHRTISRHLVANEAVVAAAIGVNSNSATGISATPVSAATTIATTDDADAISADAEDSVRRTDHVVAAAVVAAEEDNKSRHLVHRSLL